VEIAARYDGRAKRRTEFFSSVSVYLQERPNNESHLTAGRSQVFQPMFTMVKELASERNEYETDYVKSMMMDHRRGIGKVLYYDGRRLSEFPSAGSTCWIPPKTWRDEELRRILVKQVLAFQLRLLRYGPLEDRKVDYSTVTPEKKCLIRRDLYFASQISKMLLKKMEQPMNFKG